MGLFDALKSAGSAAVRVAVLPVSLAADVVTAGGTLTDRHESYTATTAKKIVKDGAEALEELHED